MVPSIYPLETLHNSLSLKQVNEFLTSVCKSAGDPHSRTSRGEARRHVLSARGPTITPLLCAHEALSAMFDPHNQPLVDTYIPQRVLSTSISLRSRPERPPWCEYQLIFLFYNFIEHNTKQHQHTYIKFTKHGGYK